MIFWLDLETTGIEPETCTILEVGLIVTNDFVDGTELDVYQSTIATSHEDLAKMNDWCQKTHYQSGLIEEVKKSGLPMIKVQNDLISLAEKYSSGKTKPILAGYSVHFDKDFLKKHMPVLHKLLDYHIIDVSSFREGLRRQYGFSLAREKSEVCHRVLPDIRAAMSDYVSYLSYFKKIDDIV